MRNQYLMPIGNGPFRQRSLWAFARFHERNLPNNWAVPVSFILFVLPAAVISTLHLCQLVQKKSARFEHGISVQINFYCVSTYVYEEHG
jgi:hypothetical protein